jgi:hypothetical protein
LLPSPFLAVFAIAFFVAIGIDLVALDLTFFVTVPIALAALAIALLPPLPLLFAITLFCPPPHCRQHCVYFCHRHCQMAAARRQRQGQQQQWRWGEVQQSPKKGTTKTAMATEIAALTYSDDN